MSATIEVCLVSYDSGDDLATAIRSVAHHVPGAAIAVQEHAETDRSIVLAARAAQEHGLAFRSHHDPRNLGFAAGCNALARTSACDWLLFLNPDAALTSWPFADGAPTTRAVLGPQIVEDGHSESHRGVSYTIGDELRRSWLRRWGPAPDGAGFVSGAALLVHRLDHEAIGGFDEGFFLFYEDIEYCLRANRNGIPTHLVEGWRVAHSGAHSTSPRFAAALQWSYESGCRFHRQQRESVAAYRSYVAADSVLRWIVHLLRRDTVSRRAYAALGRRAAADFVRRRR